MDLFSTVAGCSLLFATGACPPSAHELWPVPVRHSGVEQWQPMIAKAAQSFSLPEPWVRAVMAQESGGRTSLNGKPITSRAGAMGLMQLMPRTYADMSRLYGLGDDPYQPRDNILAGTAYLRSMYERYGYPNLFAAYNAGPGRFDDFLLRQRPLPNETLAYVAGITPGAEIALGAATITPFGQPARPQTRTVSHPTNGLFFAPDGAKALFVTLGTPHS